MDIIVWMQRITDAGGFILIFFCLRAFRMPVPFYVRLFAISSMFELAVELIQEIPGMSHYILALTTELVELSEFIIFTYIFSQIVHSKVYKWCFSGYLLFAFSYAISTFIRTNKWLDMVQFPMLFFFVFLLLGGFLFYREMVTHHQEKDPLTDFDFWLVSGFVFYSASSLAYVLLMFYLYYVNYEHYQLYFQIFQYTSFLITNIFFAKAYACLKKKRVNLSDTVTHIVS